MLFLNTLGQRSGRAGLWMAAAALLVMVGCTSPGMKLNVKSSRETTMQIEGLNVRLRPVNPELIQTQVARTAEPTSLDDLLSEKAPPYRVGPQDVLLVTVWDHPEITLPLGEYRTDSASGMVVDDEGYLYFPYVGRLLVKGLTITQVREALTQQLGKVLRNPQVDAKVLNYRSQKVYVGGEVRNPAVHSITDVPFTLAECIHRAGGFNPNADDSRLLLTRGSKTWRLDFHALMAKGNRIGQIILKDGDSLHVPNAQEDPIYMLGEVVRTGTMPLTHGNLSLARALSDAGGVSGTSADARSIYVIRPTNANNWVDVYHLDARNPTTMVLADRFALQPRDIVFVDAGTLVRFNRVMNLLLPTVSAVTSTALTAAEVKYISRGN